MTKHTAHTIKKKIAAHLFNSNNQMPPGKGLDAFMATVDLDTIREGVRGRFSFEPWDGGTINGKQPLEAAPFAIIGRIDGRVSVFQHHNPTTGEYLDTAEKQASALAAMTERYVEQAVEQEVLEDFQVYVLS